MDVLAAKIHPVTDSGGRLLLYCWVASSFSVLVPKRRGSGFLRVPFGHHENSGLSHIASIVGCDIFGLDGALEFQVTGSLFHGSEDGRLAFEKSVIPLLEAHYGISSRKIPVDEFWRLNPQCLQDAEL